MEHVPALAVFAFGGMCGASLIGGYAVWIARRMTHHVLIADSRALDSATELARIRGFAQAQRAELDNGLRCPGHADWDALTSTITAARQPKPSELH